MTSGHKRLENKKSLIKLHDKNQPQQGPANKILSSEKPKNNSISNSSMKKKRKDSMKDLLKQSYIFVKEENSSLLNKLRRKVKKIEELKNTMHTYEERIRQCQQTITHYKSTRNNNNTKESQENLFNSRKKYEEIIKESNQIAKISIDKYKKLERLMEDQQNKHQHMINTLKSENNQLQLQIIELKQKTLQNTTDRKKSKSHFKTAKKDKDEEQECQIQLKQLRQKEQIWIRKEQDLKKMLSQINHKISIFQINCRQTEEKARKYKAELEDLQEKMQYKTKKHKESNEKWHNLFKDFMKETQFLGKEIQNAKRLFYQILKQYVSKFQNGH